MGDPLSPSPSGDTLRNDLKFIGTPPTSMTSNTGWGSPFSPDFDFGTSDAASQSSVTAPSNLSTASTSSGTKWSNSAKKSRQNFAAFGAKLQSTAASAAAHATVKKKHHSDNKGGELAGAAPLLKSKMFRQSKPDLKSLTITERSPITASGSSKELDRIAAIGSPTADNSEKKHYSHLTFLKRDSPAQILSSSASNSKLASEGTVYSFQPTGQLAPSTAVHAFKSAEECFAFLTSSWGLLRSRTQSIFALEGLKIPVEDVNILVSMHFGAHVKSGGSAPEMMARLDELLKGGLASSTLSVRRSAGSDPLLKLASSWQLFYTRTLRPLESVFLPLQLEMEASGQILRDRTEAAEYWKPLRLARDGRRAVAKQRGPSIRRSVLAAYRDVVVLPLLQDIKKVISDSSYYGDAHTPEMAAVILQCINILVLVQTDDEAQRTMGGLLSDLKSSWVAQPRVGKDRRGLVLRK